MIHRINDSLRTSDEVIARIQKKIEAHTNLYPGSRSNLVEIEHRRADGTLVMAYDAWNLRTAAGAVWQAGVMGQAAGTPALYIALAGVSITPAYTDTYLGSNSVGTNETTASGLGRALGAYGSFSAQTSNNGTASFVISKVFTAGTSQSIYGVGLSNSATAQSATILFEATVATATLANTDTLTTNYTITI